MDYDSINIDKYMESHYTYFMIKWSQKKASLAPREWTETYENASYKVISKEEYLYFII